METRWASTRPSPAGTCECEHTARQHGGDDVTGDDDNEGVLPPGVATTPTRLPWLCLSSWVGWALTVSTWDTLH